MLTCGPAAGGHLCRLSAPSAGNCSLSERLSQQRGDLSHAADQRRHGCLRKSRGLEAFHSDVVGCPFAVSLEFLLGLGRNKWNRDYKQPTMFREGGPDSGLHIGTTLEKIRAGYWHRLTHDLVASGEVQIACYWVAAV